MNRNLVILTLIILAVLTRLLPHPPNFTPIGAIALFAAHRFNDKKLVFLVPIFCMLITDTFLGFSTITPFVYISFLAISCLGLYSQKINNGVILQSSTLFFVISNFGVWLLGYPNTLEGFISCYTLALPFFLNTIYGDLFFFYALNLSFKEVEKKYTALAS